MNNGKNGNINQRLIRLEGQAASQPVEIDGQLVVTQQDLDQLYDENAEPISQEEIDYYRSPIEQDELQDWLDSQPKPPWIKG
jgi:hypothetical protein